VRIVVDHIAGSRRGQRQVFEPREVLSFGRHPSSDVSFDAHRDLDASTRHAELRRRGDGYVLCDVGSSNGTLVAGARITELSLGPGPLEVEFGRGGPVVRIYLSDPEQTLPPLELPASGRARLIALALVAIASALLAAAAVCGVTMS
jgi:pSer/pThr/pTyr-binding forkhead associated (FHA) protein